MKRLTVVQTLPALYMGGVERGTLEIARALVEAGHRSIVVSSGGHLADKLRAEGSEHVNWPIGRKSPLTLRFVPKLRRLLIDEGVDILHSRSRLPAWISYLAWRSLPADIPTRFITTMHGAHSISRYSRIMTRGEKVIAVSEFIRDHILDNYPDTDPKRVVVIPRGVDPAQFPYGYKPDDAWLAQWRAEFPVLADKTLITLPARLTRRKGHEDFIRIMEELNKTGMDCHGLMVGGRDPRRQAYADSLEQQVRAHALQGRIHLLGHRDDLREIMAISAVVLVLSREPESFGRCTAEALSLGIPVVGYSHGGTREILDNLFPQGKIVPGEVQQAVAQITKLIGQPPVINENKVFTLNNMLNSTLAVYGELSDISETH